MTLSKTCVITDEATRDAGPNVNLPVPKIRAPAGATFEITDSKLYAPIVTLPTEDDNKLLEQLKSGFKRTINWNKCRSEMSNQTKTKNLNYLIDPTFRRVNRLFALSFENQEDMTSFPEYYITRVKIKGFNELIDGRSFFNVPIKNKEENNKAIIEISKNNDYTTGSLLDYDYFWKYWKLFAIDLSKQIELENSDLKQKTIFFGKLEEDDGPTIFLIIEKLEETTFEFSQNSASII